jgi:hypothetical protein
MQRTFVASYSSCARFAVHLFEFECVLVLLWCIFIYVHSQPLSPEELVVHETFDDFSQLAHGGDQGAGFEDEALYTIPHDSLQDAMIRLFNRHIPEEVLAYELNNCEECDASYEELTFEEFKSLYFRYPFCFMPFLLCLVLENTLTWLNRFSYCLISVFPPFFLVNQS